MNEKTLPTTSGLASVGMYARGKFCWNLKIYRPFELLRSPARTPSLLNDNVGEADPDYVTIFSKIPSGKYSVYFFDSYYETQQEWDSIRDNRLYYRKDVTLQELIDNKYEICYP